MAHWLLKVEPSVYSWEQFKKDGTTTWDGIRNYAARNHLRAMKKDEEVFIYYSMEETAVVGTAKVSREAFPDPTADDDTWSAVDLKIGKKLKNPVSLKRIKALPELQEMALVRISRLSVGPVTDNEWDIIMKMSEEEE